MRHTFAISLLSAALVLLGACGQMGPLYMPPPEEAPQAEPAAPDESEQASTSAP